MTDAVIPHRPVFRAQEVCELADVQPYVLRTWEAEFPDLGVARTAAGPRVYRRADVERVLRIKHLLFAEGLTLSGVRRRLVEEGATAPPAEIEDVSDREFAALVDDTTRRQLRSVRSGLEWILDLLGEGRAPSAAGSARASLAPARRPSASATRGSRASSKRAGVRKTAGAKANRAQKRGGRDKRR